MVMAPLHLRRIMKLSNLVFSAIYVKAVKLRRWHLKTHLVCMQSIGLPTRWRVVRAALAASRAAVVAPQCSRNATESIFGLTPCCWKLTLYIN